MKAERVVRCSRNTRGQSLVEFALVAFGLIMTLWLIVDMCRMALTYTTMANAAKAGARYAIVNGVDSSNPSGPTTDDATVVSVVKTFGSAAGIKASNLTVHVYYYPAGGSGTACNNPGCWVQVTASYLYTPLTSYLPFNVHLSATSEGVITF